MAEHEELLMERNQLLRESVELQREHLNFSKQQATEQQKRLGDYSDQLLKEGMKDILSELKVAAAQSIPEDDQIIMDHVREAIKKLELLDGNLPDLRTRDAMLPVRRSLARNEG